MKRIISLIIVCCLMIIAIPSTISAAQKEPISPMWTNVNGLNAFITFSGSTGNVTVLIVGKSGVTNITADVKLYYKNTSGSWIEISTDWDYNVNQMTLTINESFDAVAGREYKIEVDGSVTKSGYAEPISTTASATCPRS